MANFSVTISGQQQIQNAFDAAPETVREIMNPVLQTAINILGKYTTKGIVPWRTGRLTQSFIATYGDLVAMWRPTVNYAGFVNDGTGPHVIVPTEKRALFWPGAAHPVRMVKHPGTKPNPYMDRIVQNAQSDLDTLFQKAADQLTRQLSGGSE